jgi:hypothetical protein
MMRPSVFRFGTAEAVRQREGMQFSSVHPILYVWSFTEFSRTDGCIVSSCFANCAMRFPEPTCRDELHPQRLNHLTG